MQDCDIVSFFTSFERILQLHEVDKGLWPKLLPSQLSAKAIREYSRLSLDETKCYETVKRIILQSYNLTADAYLKSFRGMKRSGASTYKMFLTSLREMMERYMDARKISTLSDLVEANIQEQFLMSLKDNVRQFVLSKSPRTAAECAEYADLYFTISKIGKETDRPDFRQRHGQAEGPPRFVRPNFGGVRPSGNGGAHVPFRNAGPPQPPNGMRFRVPNAMQANRFAPNNAATNTKHQNQGSKNGTYFVDKRCKRVCRNDVNLCDDVCDVSCNDQCNSMCGHDALANSESGIDSESQFVVPISVNGIRCKGLRDTAAFVPVIVDEKLVPKQHVNYDKKIKCVGLFSGENGKCIPTAKIKIRSPWFSVKGDIKVTAAVTKLPAGLFCILGNSFFQDQNIPDIIHVTKPREMNAGEPSMTTPGPDPETRGHPGHVAVNDKCEYTENCESVTKINTDSAQNTSGNTVIEMTERQRDAKVGGAGKQPDDGGIPVSVNRPRTIANELISDYAETAVKQMSEADGTTTLEPPETGERERDEIIAIIETRR